jgi:hypothetical protein
VGRTAKGKGKGKPIDTALLMRFMRILTVSDLKTLICLVDYRNEDTGLCCPSYETIMKETGMHRATLWSAIKHLRALGIITVKHTGSVDTKGGRDHNEYTINNDAKPGT